MPRVRPGLDPSLGLTRYIKMIACQTRCPYACVYMHIRIYTHTRICISRVNERHVCAQVVTEQACGLTLGDLPRVVFDEGGRARSRATVTSTIIRKTNATCSPHWQVVTEQACHAYGLVSVPLWFTLGTDYARQLLIDSGVACVLCGERWTGALLRMVRNDTI